MDAGLDSVINTRMLAAPESRLRGLETRFWLTSLDVDHAASDGLGGNVVGADLWLEISYLEVLRTQSTCCWQDYLAAM